MRRATVLRGLVAVAVLISQATAAMAQSPSIAGVWRIAVPVDAVQTSQGKPPPLTPRAAKVFKAHQTARAAGDLSHDSAAWCASVGMPRAMLINYPFEIVVGPHHVSVLHEWNWWARTIYLDGALQQSDNPADAPQSGTTMFLGGSDPNGPMGLSQGHWEGDTLVVETTHLLGSKQIDNAGLPYSDALRITERLRLADADTLEDRMRFDDPATFSQPWETVQTYRRQSKPIAEDVCLDRLREGKPAVAD